MLEKSRAAGLSQFQLGERWPAFLLFVQSFALYIRIVAILCSQVGISCCPLDHLFHKKENNKEEGEGSTGNKNILKLGRYFSIQSTFSRRNSNEKRMLTCCHRQDRLKEGH